MGHFPEEGIDALYKANKLRNSLVEIHNTHSEYYDQSRRDADTEYNTLKMELEALEETKKKPSIKNAMRGYIENSTLVVGTYGASTKTRAISCLSNVLDYLV